MYAGFRRRGACTFTTAEMQPADKSFLDQEDYYDAQEDEEEA